MIDLLHSKKESTKFQILVEITAHQPNVRQREIAEKVGITPQAVSEYGFGLRVFQAIFDTIYAQTQ